MNHEEKAVAKAAVNKFRMERARSYWTSESKEKNRLARVGLKRTPEQKERMSLAAKGRKLSEETKEKIRLKALGRKHSEETKTIIREKRSKQPTTSKMLAALANNRGEKSLMWKGAAVGYRALHKWVENRLGKPGDCARCEKTGLTGHQIHWANISGEYKRELSDWIRLCALCHKRNDLNLLN